MRSYVVVSVPADGLAPVGARTSAGTIMTTYIISGAELRKLLHDVIEQNDWHFADNIFKCNLLKENFVFLFKSTVQDPHDNKWALVQVMTGLLFCAKPLSEPMMCMCESPDLSMLEMNRFCNWFMRNDISPRLVYYKISCFWFCT